MIHFVWPIGGLREVFGNPRLDPVVHANVIASRRAELEQLRGRIVSELDIPPASRAAVASTIAVLPGTGQLLIDDAYVDIGRLVERLPNLYLAVDGPLPKMKLATTSTGNNTPAQQWHFTSINKPTTLTGAGATIGVIDTGCDNSTLPDLIAPFLPTFADFKPFQAGQGGKPAQPPEMVQTTTLKDYGTHGSTVCSFLAGNISGVAPGAQVIVAAVPAGLQIDNQSMLGVALDWLVTMGCDIITTSLFTGAQGEIPTGPLGPGATLEGVEYGLLQARTVHKTVVTAAIGNTGTSGKFQHPGSSPNVIGVGAITEQSQLFGSAWGSIAPHVFKPDIVAPGQQLELPTSATSFDFADGTSFAAPIVAGALALILEDDASLKGDPAGLTAKLLTLVKGVLGSPPANSTGAGRLDLSALSHP